MWDLAIQAIPAYLIFLVAIYDLTYRDPKVLWFSLVWAFLAIWNKLLKNQFKNYSFGARPNPDQYCGVIPRCPEKSKPSGGGPGNTVPSRSEAFSGGFPSTHATFVGFALSVYFLTYFSGGKDLLMAIIALGVGTAILVNRYTTGCHTIFQIVFGLVEGLLVGSITSSVLRS